MKNLKKLVIASFMLVIAFVAVVSSTYAWFTRGTDAKVNDITISVVDAQKSLLIGRANGVWSRNVTVDPVGKMTPVTLVSKTNGTQVDKFSQLVWSDDLVPTMPDAKKLNETQDNIEQYIQAGETFAVNTTYYSRTGEGTEASPYVYAPAEPQPTSENYNATGLYVVNPQYVGEGYIQFDLYFQITVDKPTDWSSTYIEMNITGLRAWDYNNNVLTETNNERAMSSFRLAVAEGNSGILAAIVQGKGAGMTGVYGEGDQFKAPNGWLEMLNNSAINANDAIIEDVAAAESVPAHYALTHKDAASIDANLLADYDTSGDATGNPTYEYTMHCLDNDNNATIAGSDSDLTKTFKITIYVWMEGWDGDNINAAANCQYKFGLSFRAR